MPRAAPAAVSGSPTRPPGSAPALHAADFVEPWRELLAIRCFTNLMISQEFTAPHARPASFLRGRAIPTPVAPALAERRAVEHAAPGHTGSTQLTARPPALREPKFRAAACIRWARPLVPLRGSRKGGNTQCPGFHAIAAQLRHVACTPAVCARPLAISESKNPRSQLRAMRASAATMPPAA